MNGLNTARGDFVPVGDGILPPGALLFQAKSRRGGAENHGGGNVPPHRHSIALRTLSLVINSFCFRLYRCHIVQAMFVTVVDDLQQE